MRGTTIRRSIATVAVVLALAAIMAGCASTDIRSQTSPDYRGQPYEKIAVWIDIDDALTAHRAEDFLVEELVERGVDAVPQYSVFFAGRDYTYAQRQRELDKKGIDAVLTIELTDSGATKHRTPDRLHRVRRVNPYTGRVHTHSEWTRGHVDVDAWADFSAELIDRAGGDVVWLAVARTAGDPSIGRAGFTESVSREVADQLIKDGLVVTD
jgi:major membrane immunogen (membrane-anchored lipoprotein)